MTTLRRWMSLLALLMLLMPALAIVGCEASADDDGASIDIPPDARND